MVSDLRRRRDEGLPSAIQWFRTATSPASGTSVIPRPQVLSRYYVLMNRYEHDPGYSGTDPCSSAPWFLVGVNWCRSHAATLPSSLRARGSARRGGVDTGSSGATTDRDPAGGLGVRCSRTAELSAIDRRTDDPNYTGADVPIRSDLVATHRFLLDHIRSPGTWWTGTERVAIAAASRAAASCRLCRDRQGAVSPNAVRGRHDGTHELPEDVVDVVHRIRSDPARLSREWFDGVIAGGLDVGRYVELVGVTTMTAGMDYFARAIGIAPLPLPEPRGGEPSRQRPAAAKLEGAWVPMIAPENARGAEADLYGDGFVPNIMRALSLVPDEVRALQRSTNAHYVPVAQIPDPTARRALDRAQMELLAARVSALNECFY